MSSPETNSDFLEPGRIYVMETRQALGVIRAISGRSNAKVLSDISHLKNYASNKLRLTISRQAPVAMINPYEDGQDVDDSTAPWTYCLTINMSDKVEKMTPREVIAKLKTEKGLMDMDIRKRMSKLLAYKKEIAISTGANGERWNGRTPLNGRLYTRVYPATTQNQYPAWSYDVFDQRVIL